ncbi:hypothetical protein KKD19_02255 [Patescibacteria group bacterium]|nr:hypothetical protein [Patescibacteria group bacterium]MCG2693260.1 hypothetical protein [Candidatus Parcubacteria bacterium]
MTQTQLIQIKQGLVKVPPKLRKYWQNQQVYVRFSPESIYIKKVEPASFWQVRDELKEVSKLITQKDINEAVKWARSQSGDK